MIPRANITAWRAVAPWPSNEQVEQDVENPWFIGTAALTVYHLDELLGTKLRALENAALD